MSIKNTTTGLESSGCERPKGRHWISSELGADTIGQTPGTTMSKEPYNRGMNIGLPELIAAAVAVVLVFFGWLIFRPQER